MDCKLPNDAAPLSQLPVLCKINVYVAPATMEILLMEEVLHLFVGSLSRSVRGLYIPSGAGSLPSTVSWDHIRFIFHWLKGVIAKKNLNLLEDEKVFRKKTSANPFWGMNISGSLSTLGFFCLKEK